MMFFGVGLILPGASTTRVAAIALTIAFAVELLKLWQLPGLAAVRHTTIGHLVFGHVFSQANLVAYAVGVAVGTGLERLMIGMASRLSTLPSRRAER
jgi:hypothetical protein